MAANLRENITVADAGLHLRGGCPARRAREVRRRALAASDSMYARQRPSSRCRTCPAGTSRRSSSARWLRMEPKVLVLDEPTQGVDVGAKADIHTPRRRGGRSRARPYSSPPPTTRSLCGCATGCSCCGAGGWSTRLSGDRARPRRHHRGHHRPLTSRSCLSSRARADVRHRRGTSVHDPGTKRSRQSHRCRETTTPSGAPGTPTGQPGPDGGSSPSGSTGSAVFTCGRC